SLAVLLLAMIVGISFYLSPDDLAKCDAGPTVFGKCRTAKAIVVISGGDTDARTDEAIRLYKDGWAKYLVVSTGLSNAAAMRQRAMSRGVPENAILMDEYSETTKQNASKVKQILDKKGIDDIILVTSGYHMRRASLEFSSNLDPKITVRSHPVGSDKHWGIMWWATPWGWWLSGSELVKIGLFYVGGSQ
ncbi:hypothetical protein CR969_03210, partial [Candidatus Saccharibacteria bacterium]